MSAVREPFLRMPGRGPNEVWFFAENAGRYPWLHVVVHYEGGDGMDRDRVSEKVAAAPVRIAGVEFDHVEYDRRGDVLYADVGEPGKLVVDYDGTAEGDGTRYGPDGNLVGLTILNARLRLEQDGKIELTLPEHKVVVTDLGDLLK